MQVETDKGLIDFDQLEIVESYLQTPEARLTKTQMLFNGEVVREHVNESKWRGLDPSEIEFTDFANITDNSRDVISEWRVGGELVRRNQFTTILRTLDMGLESQL